MSPYPSPSNPWPAPTPPPILSSSTRSIRKRRPREDVSPPDAGPSSIHSLSKRQVIASAADIAKAKSTCMWQSGNEVISCFPTEETVVNQHEWATFIWNSRRPQITQTNKVDVFLFSADSQQQLLHFPNITNPSLTLEAGTINAQVNDSWFGERGKTWNGGRISYPFYWVLIRSDETLDGAQIPQATFQAVQTTYADSVMTSMMAASSAASAARGGGTGGLQRENGGSSFPHWAIAVIAVLGFLAITAGAALIFFFLRWFRKRRSRSTNRSSIGSSSPIMAGISRDVQSPVLGQGGGLVKQPSSSAGHHSIVSPDGASTISHTGSAGDSGPFSGADAAIMADAFRKALRKPDFAGQPTPEEAGENGTPESDNNRDLINRQLAEEGRDVRKVHTSRGVRVESMSSEGGTSADPPH